MSKNYKNIGLSRQYNLPVHYIFCAFLKFCKDCFICFVPYIQDSTWNKKPARCHCGWHSMAYWGKLFINVPLKVLLIYLLYNFSQPRLKMFIRKEHLVGDPIGNKDCKSVIIHPQGFLKTLPSKRHGIYMHETNKLNL